MITNVGVYQVVHKPSGKIYVGSSVNLKTRQGYHFTNGHFRFPSSTDANKSEFRKNIHKKPMDLFHFGVLEYFPNSYPKKKLREREKEWIWLIDFNLSLNIKHRRNNYLTQLSDAHKPKAFR